MFQWPNISTFVSLPTDHLHCLHTAQNRLGSQSRPAHPDYSTMTSAYFVLTQQLLFTEVCSWCHAVQSVCVAAKGCHLCSIKNGPKKKKKSTQSIKNVTKSMLSLHVWVDLRKHLWYDIKCSTLQANIHECPNSHSVNIQTIKKRNVQICTSFFLFALCWKS